VNSKNVKGLVSRFLLLALLGAPFLMICQIDEADAWLMHQTNCRTIAEASASAGVEVSKGGGKAKAEVKVSVRIECDTEFHWNPLPHGDSSSSSSSDSSSSSSSDSSSGSCDSEGPDWCVFCEEEHWVCNYGTGW